MGKLSETDACGFEELFADVQTRAGLIVTFLALLEMIRLKLVRVFQSGAMGPIRIYKRARPADAPKPLLDPEVRHARRIAGWPKQVRDEAAHDEQVRHDGRRSDAACRAPTRQRLTTDDRTVGLMTNDEDVCQNISSPSSKP